MEMLPERTAAWRSVGASGGITLSSLCISSATLLQPTVATHRTCTEDPCQVLSSKLDSVLTVPGTLTENQGQVSLSQTAPRTSQLG